MSGLVALVGGHEHTPGCEALDGRLLRASGVRTPEVAVLLGASPQRRRAFKQAEAERWWKGLGARARCAFAGEPDPAERAGALLAEADLVVLTGGRPWLLRERLRATGVDRLVRACAAAGVPLAGSSAGAMALAGWAWSLRAPRPFALVPALGAVPGVLVAPHAGRHGVDGRAAATQGRHPDVEVLLVADRTGVLVDATGARTVVGPGTARSLAHGAPGAAWHQDGLAADVRASACATSAGISVRVASATAAVRADSACSDAPAAQPASASATSSGARSPTR